MARTLLLWDAPNIDMTLSGVLGRRASTVERPRFDSLGRWLVEQARVDDLAPMVEGCVFVNVPVAEHGPLLGWVKVLLTLGFRVFAKPRQDDSDIDEDMLEHMVLREADLGRVIVASNDAEAFRDSLERLAARGVHCTVLGFTEYSGGYTGSDGISFVDLEEIPELFNGPLPNRVRLEGIPVSGRWFEPSSALGDLLASGNR
jgi:putative heme uptake system protein